MHKTEIWLERRNLKKAAHVAVRNHYFLLVFLCLLMIFFGTEFNLARISWGQLYKDPGDAAEETHLVETRLFKGSLVDSLMEKRLERLNSLRKSVRVKTEEAILKANKGVFASLAKDINSGRFFYVLGEGIYDIVSSDSWSIYLIATLMLLLGLFEYMFLKCFYSAAIRRVILEARTYKKTSFPSLFHIQQMHRWPQASLTMFVKEILYSLWGLTIVGLAVKRYSYMAVPYIVAENPGLSPLQAITLSRRMMDGHKREMFCYELSLLPWRLLGLLTFGISDMFYGVPYCISCEAEAYVRVREDAIKRGVEGIEALSDPYLFKKADRIELYETYFDVVDEITLLHEEKMELPPARKALCEKYGIWLGSLSEKRRYDDHQGREYLLKSLKESMEGEAYPKRLNGGFKNQRIPRQGHFFFLRSYAPHVLILLFMMFSMVGWLWEVNLHLLQTGELVNRGMMHGPWLPIYGTGGCVVMLLCNRFRKKPVAEFFVSMGLCGIIEYFTSWYLEKAYHKLWWSYEGYFLNLNGRICAEGLLVFGLGCMIVVYVVAPLFDYQVNKLKKRNLSLLCFCLLLVFSIDWIYSLFYPNDVKGAADAIEQPLEPTQGQEAGEN